MGTTDSNGVWFWDENDIFAPVHTALNLGQSNLSSLVTGLRDATIHYVANETARATLATQFVPSASRPLYVHRGNANDGRYLEMTTNGTTWTPIQEYKKFARATWANLTSASTTPVAITALDTFIAVRSGEWYEFSAFYSTYSDGGNNDLTNSYFYITPTSGTGAQVSVVTDPASNPRGTTFTAAQRPSTLWQAPATASYTVGLRFSRGAGVGVVTTNNASGSAYGPGWLKVRSI